MAGTGLGIRKYWLLKSTTVGWEAKINFLRAGMQRGEQPHGPRKLAFLVSLHLQKSDLLVNYTQACVYVQYLVIYLSVDLPTYLPTYHLSSV